MLGGQTGRSETSQVCQLHCEKIWLAKEPRWSEGLSYFFTERVKGKIVLPEEMEGHELKAFIETYAAFMIKLSTLEFDGYGSLQHVRGDSKNGVIVGPLMCKGRFNKRVSPYWFGPFMSTRERYLTHIDHILEHIGEDGFYDDQPIMACLLHLYARDLVERNAEMAIREEVFYIRHIDHHEGQTLTDDGRITAVLDWEW
jgi:hypothetical protein